MASLYNSDLKPLAAGTQTHPYQHATKLFLADNFRLAPKQQYLYYVVINVNNNLGGDILSQVVNLFNQQIFTSGISDLSVTEQYEVGLMAKRADLPKFKINTQTKNAYNRKNVVQTQIIYDPISITFHDDAADVVTKFWNNYYTYYYRDSDYTDAYYSTKHKYQPRLTDSWGFTPRNSSTIPFLTSIQVFSLHNKRFTEYEYINPVISDWRHGEHNSEMGTGILENIMTIQYETVKYKTGYINPVDVSGFAAIHYDNVQSPISTSITNIYDDNGLVGVLSSGTKDLARPDGSGSGANIFNALLNIYSTSKTLRASNLTNLAKTSLASLGLTAINNAVNAALGNNITVPTPSAAAGSGIVYATSNILSNTYSNPVANYGVTSGGVSLSQSLGAGTIAVGQQITNNAVSGVVTSAVTQGSTNLFQVSTSAGGQILVDAAGQPVTNQTTSVTFNPQGQPIATQQVLTTAAGTFNADSPTDNRVSQTYYKQEDGTVWTQSNYVDGTVVHRDNSGQVVSIEPGNAYTTDTIPAAVPINSSVNAQNGIVNAPGAVNYYTDPRTGVTTTVGGTSAQITNTITGALGGVGAAYAGQETYKALTGGFLGKSVLGQTVAAGIGSVVGLQTGKLVNNALQPITNSIVGGIGQVYDDVTGSIKNTAGQIFGTGGYNPSNPNQNVVSKPLPDAFGSVTTVYKDGTTVVDGTVTQAATSGSWFTNLFSGWGADSSSIAANPTFSFGSSTNNDVFGSIWTDGTGNPILSGTGDVVSTGWVGPSVDPTAAPVDDWSLFY